MIVSTRMEKFELNMFSKKNNKKRKIEKVSKLYKIIPGLYETYPYVPGYFLAGSICGPSYISFEFALSFHGLIHGSTKAEFSEKGMVITCATFNKKKEKQYDTKFGVFTYRDVPVLAYPEEILLEEGYLGNYYQIATKEKALCDQLYVLDLISNYSDLEVVLFSILYIDIEEFSKLDVDKIEKLSNLYCSPNVNLLAKYMRRGIDE